MVGWGVEGGGEGYGGELPQPVLSEAGIVPLEPTNLDGNACVSGSDVTKGTAKSLACRFAAVRIGEEFYATAITLHALQLFTKRSFKKANS